MSCNDTATVNQVAVSEQEKAKQMLLMYFLDTNATISEVSDDGTVYKVVFSDGHYVEIKNIAYDIDNYISYILALDDKLLFGFSDGEQKEKYFKVDPPDEP